jgi:phage protein D
MALGVAIRVDNAPDPLAGAAESVEVTESIGQPTYYRLDYSFDIESGDFPLLSEGKLGPGSELSVVVSSDTVSECLVKGPVFGQQIRFHQGGSGSLLTVQGADSLIKLDREDKAVAWSNLTDSAAVSSILSQVGLVPDIETTQAGHFEMKHTLIQRETDLSFIRRLARRNGFLFWLSCDATGVETAHFKRPPLNGQANCDLVINLTDPRSNVTSLQIDWDVERPTQTASTELDLNNKSDLSGAVQSSPLTALGGTALGNIVTDARVAHVSAPVDDSGDLQARSEGTLIDASFFLRATGSTTLSSLGKVLRSHSLVNLRGVGARHSGLWFCSAVKHSIDSSEHRMDFDLIRNGWTG